MVRKRIKKNTDEKHSVLYADITGVLLIALGFFILLSIISPNTTGILGIGMQKLVFVLAGIGSLVVPFYLVFLGICYIKVKGKFHANLRFYGIILFILNTMILIQNIVWEKYYSSQGIIKGFNNLINSDNIFHGGLIAYILNQPIRNLFGEVGSYLIYFAIYIVSLIMIVQITIGVSINLLLSKFSIKNNNEVKPTKRINIDNNSSVEKMEKKFKLLDFLKSNEPTEESLIENKQTEIKIEVSEEKDTKAQVPIEAFEKEIEENKKIMIPSIFKLPELNLLNENNQNKTNKNDKKDLLSSAAKLEETLQSFGVDAKVIQVSKGPSVTRFELQPSPGVKVSRIVNLADDIALNLAASGVRIEAPIPGKAAIGIEVPNSDVSMVYLKEVLESKTFLEAKGTLAFALGKDVSGNCVVADLTKMPHTLIAGATGSGKSVCINTLIVSLLYKYSADEVRLLMIDPKVVELSVYNGIPHLLIPVVTNPKKAAGALNWAVNEMTKRYKLFAENNARNIEGYNDLVAKGRVEEKMQLIVIIIDELADLMMVCPGDVEDYIARLAQMARAAGIHLVIATQRPSVDVITGVIKANIPSRISFAVSSQIDSRTILDSSGAEKLLGKGDMLYSPQSESKPIRIQGAFISEDEVERVVNFIKNQGKEVQYKEEIISAIESNNTSVGEEEDELIDEAIQIVIETGAASTSMLQRKLRIGYNRAARIIDALEANGVISQKDGSNKRNVLISREENN